MSCTGTSNKPQTNEDFFAQLLNKHYALKVECPNDALCPDSMKLNKDSCYMVYITDASCSLCIGKLLEFANQIESADIKERIYILVDSEYRSIVEFYIEKHKRNLKHYTIIENRNFSIVKGRIEQFDLNGFLLNIQKGQVVSSILFTGANDESKDT